MKYHCKYCGRYIMDIEGTTIVENLICPNSKCKARLNVKVVTPESSEADVKYKFKTQETPSKT